jgi:hypothetical protein
MCIRTWCIGGVSFCANATTAGVVVTLTHEAYARWRQEETTPAEDVWPTLWGAVPVQVGRINAVWVPLSWLPTHVAMPSRGTAAIAGSNWRTRRRGNDESHD